MPFRTNSGQIVPLEMEWDDLPMAMEDLMLGQAAQLSECSCEIQRRLRTGAEAESR
jgi:hypothetical protein